MLYRLCLCSRRVRPSTAQRTSSDNAKQPTGSAGFALPDVAAQYDWGQPRGVGVRPNHETSQTSPRFEGCWDAEFSKPLVLAALHFLVLFSCCERPSPWACFTLHAALPA
jgi:hypothetical protein